VAARPAAVRTTAGATIRVHPINGFIGAEIEGLDLRRPLSPAQFKIVHDALVQYEVIVMRGQDITVDQQMAFGALFGELSIHPFSPNLVDKPEVIILDYSADNPPALTDIWHADETFREAPPLGTILRAKVVPETGGDTLFASMSAAYRGLSERMKQHIHGLEALHDFKPWRPLFGQSDRAKLRKLEDEFPNPWHPVVRVHPVSGRRIVYVNQQFCVRIKDLKTDESDALLAFLYRQATIPEYQLRVKWEPDMVVMWGQSIRSALRRARLLSGAPDHGACDGEGRPAQGRSRVLCPGHSSRQRHRQTGNRGGDDTGAEASLRPLLIPQKPLPQPCH
jgi:taurine dioxygenase